MKHVLIRGLWYILGAATVWQIYASLQRCGSIDGGALLIPLLIVLVPLCRESVKDLRETFFE